LPIASNSDRVGCERSESLVSTLSAVLGIEDLDMLDSPVAAVRNGTGLENGISGSRSRQPILTETRSYRFLTVGLGSQEANPDGGARFSLNLPAA
jgi:hypothetical protein